jgi:hypothetical protein
MAIFDTPTEFRSTVNLRAATTLTFRDGQIAKSALIASSLGAFPVRIDTLKVWDDLSANLPGTAATDDLAIIEGTFGTDAPTIQTSDAKATTVTQRLRYQYPLPENYVAGDDVQVRIRGGMITTVSDTTATVDVECYAHDGDGGVGSDLCATAAQTINSLTKADKDFVITTTGLTPGTVLDIRVTIAITDGATGTAVIGEIVSPVMLLDVR